MSESNLFRSVLTAIFVLSLTFFAFGDTIRLKDGSLIKGKVVSFSNGKFVMLIGEGERQRQMVFFADEIESIEFDNGAPSPLKSKTVSDNRSDQPSFTKTTKGNETIITVGAPKNEEPIVKRDEPVSDAVSDAKTDDPPADAVDKDPITVDNAPTKDQPDTNAKPIQIKVKVLADNTANGWTNAGWVVRKGQKIRIISNGRISLGNGRSSGPNGLATLPDENKLIKDRPTGSLIAVIGDDNNDFIFIGEKNEFVATRDGALFLGVNEGLLDDNSGSFDVIVEIEAGNGS